jgi:hypothetical protein
LNFKHKKGGFGGKDDSTLKRYRKMLHELMILNGHDGTWYQQNGNGTTYEIQHNFQKIQHNFILDNFVVIAMQDQHVLFHYQQGDTHLKYQA